MATYVNDLRLKEIGTGESSGTWGTETNTNLELIAEAFSYGTEASFGSDADATTTIADGATDPARSLYLKVTSGASLTATRTLTIAPNTVSKVWIIENATSGSQSINISQGSGANVTIPNGDVKVVYSDGAGSGAAVVDAFTDLNLGGTTTVAGLSVSSTTTFSDDVTFTGASNNLVWDKSDDSLEFADNAKAKFGASDDLQIYHDGSNSRIQEAGTGSLLVRGSNLQLQDSDGYDYLTCTDGGNGGTVALKHLGSTVLSTASGGIDVTGTVNNMTIASNGSGFTCPTGQNFVINSPNGLRINIDSNNDGSSENFVVGHNQDDAANANVLLKITEAGTSTFFSTATTDTVVLQSTDAGASAAPDLVLFRDSSSPADGDDIGNILFRGKDDGGNETSYAFILGEINDASDGSEDGNLFFRTQSAGSLDNRLSIVSNKIGINTDSPDTIMEIRDADPVLTVRDTETGVANANATLRLAESGASDTLGSHFDVGLGNNQILTFGFSNDGTAATEQMKLVGATGNLVLTTNPSSLYFGDTSSGSFVKGTNTGGYLILGTSNTERARLTTTGLGIGTTTADLLSIAFDGNISSDYTAFNVDIGKASGSAITNLKGINVDLASADITGGDEITNLYGAYINNSTAGGAAGVITNWWGIYVPEADPDRTDNPVSAYFGDSVGIGTNDPQAPLHARNGSSGVSSYTAGTRAIIEGTATTYLTLAAPNTSISGILFADPDDSDNGYIKYDHSASGNMDFGTAGSNRIRINDTGEVLIGTTSSVRGAEDLSIEASSDAIAVRTAGAGLIVRKSSFTNGFLCLFETDGGSAVGSITSNGSTTAYNTSSDGRLKDITGEARGLEVINKLNPVSYNWKEDGKADEGLIAQEVLDIVPNAVTQNEEDEMYQMDYSKLVVHLVKGMKEQQAIIESLTARITTLEG